MKNKMLFTCLFTKTSRWVAMLVTLFVLLVNVEVSAQCVAPPGTIQGDVYTDLDNNGLKATSESGLAGVVVHAYNSGGQIVGTTNTASNGSWSIPNLANGSEIKLVFTYPTKYSPSFIGSDNSSTVQFVTVPSCSSKLGLLSYNDVCNGETMIVTPCYVQGSITQNSNQTTLVGIKYGFDINSQPVEIAKHSETGSVWGITYKQSTSEIFSSAFVKQLVGLKNGHDAIFRTVKSGSTYTTTSFTKLSSLGQPVGTLNVTDVADCNYGSQVGKMGLGALIISPDEKYLYTVNLFNNTLVRIPTVSPTAANTIAFNIPNPNCGGGSARPFALKYHKDKIYVGVTCTADVSLDDNNSSANVYEYNPANNTWTLIFSTPYLKGFWFDTPTNRLGTMQWLTDIDFSDDGNMILGLSDRLGHKYCDLATNNRLDEQKPDILMVWNNNGVWTLESNGSAGALIGAGVGNGQGPNNGEFFGHDFFPANPSYHSEVSLGGLYVMPGTNSVVSVVFDPDQNTYSGGLHRYSTSNGQLIGKRELYTRNLDVTLGKATGFGDVIAICNEPEIELGNLVWLDINNNGVQDAGEDPVSGLKLNLYDTNCDLITSTTTNSLGQYAFNRINSGSKVIADANYYIGIDNSQRDVTTGNIVLNGEYYQLTQSINNQANTDSDAQNSVTNCPKASVAARTSTTSHNFDIGLKSLGSCDVRITSSLEYPSVTINDPLIYNIVMSNTGGTLLTGFELSNPIPTGMTFAASENAGWTNTNGVLTYINTGNLAPNQASQVKLILRYDPVARNNNHTNRTSISRLKDFNNVWTDELEGCLLDEENGYADVTPIICDLALSHNVKKDQFISKKAPFTLVSTICNQGNVVATDLVIVNYIDPSFDFNPAINRDWVISQDLQFVTLSTNIPIQVGECRDFEITYTLKPTDNIEGLVNGIEDIEEIAHVSEILSCGCFGTPKNKDFDSTPDNRKTNDNGGRPNTGTDNEVNDRGQIDEDDHDPALISFRVVDFALRKSVKTRRVYPNGLVTFDLTVTNQGDVAASKVQITDYIPKYLTLSDPKWTMAGSYAESTVDIPGNLQPGASVTTTITFRVDSNVPVPFTIDNIAELTNAYDALGRDVSAYDVDSTPDNIFSLETEDDISRATIVLYDIQALEPCPECRQGTTPDNGQFISTITIAGPSNEEWVVESSLNLYDETSALPPAAPIALADGYTLTEVPIASMPGHSNYTLKAVYIQGQSYAVRFINKFRELEQFENTHNIACNFDNLTITGPQSVCDNAIFEYVVETDADTDELTWYVDGVEIAQDVLTLTIDWASYGIGDHVITVVSNDNPCIPPVEYFVSAGVADVTSISCISNLNISLDGDCEIEVTPSMLIAGTINPTSPYVVMLMDQSGNIIPSSPFVNKEHIGKRFMAKLIDGCGGNSCWSNILVEDKLAPVTICRNIELPCDKLDEYTGPFETDNCGSPIETKLINEVITLRTCDEDYVKFIDRQYQATDAAGNKSAICSMRISLLRPDMSLLTFPHSRMMSNDSVLVCGADLSPDSLGVPMLAGKPIYPNFNSACNVYAGYTDEEYDLGCSRKIVRKWVVIEDWCSNPNLVYTRNQILEIIDTLPPTITPLPNQVVSTNGSTMCVGDVVLAVPVVSDSCSSVMDIDVIYPGFGFIDNMTSPTTITLPVGEHTIQYIVYDECDNSSSMSIVVTVEDKTAPTMLCKGTTAVGLNNNGEGFIYPHHIDNGSYDGCGIADRKLALMTGTANIPLNQFGPSLKFGCADAGKTFMVALLVSDASGNTNICMVSVEVQDKIAPVITCPPHRTIECGEIDNNSDLTIYGVATAFDVCGADITEDTPSRILTTCGTGTVTRYFTADDSVNIARCIQVITIAKTDKWNHVTDLDMSIDFEIEDMCSMTDIHPDNLQGLRGRPVIRQDLCDMVAADYDDRIFNIVQGACMKILRKWTVIDWCEMEEDPDYEPFEFTQVIKVTSTVDPEFLVDEIAETDTVFSAQGNCIDAPFSASVSASHDCTLTGLEWSYTIDFGNNGSIDEEGSAAGDEFDIVTDLPLGQNRIVYSFEDGCGNVVTRTKIVLALNRDLPTVVPINPVIIAIQPWDTDGDGTADIEKACLDAATLNASSTASCCVGIPLTYSFSSDPDSTTMCFDCFDVGPHNFVQLWAHDCNGNSSFTVVQVIVQDNNNSNICEILCQNNRPIISLNTPSPACPGGAVVLTATVTNANVPAGANAKFLWSTGATTATVTVNPITTTTYTVTVSNKTGCTSTASITLTVRAFPTIVVNTPDDNICMGETTSMTATGASTYVWSTGATTSTVNVSPITTTTYTVTGTDAAGCTNTATRTITVAPLPVVAINPPSPVICAGGSTQLTASVVSPLGTPTFVWSNGLGTNATVTVSPATTTTYTVTATVNGCSNTSTRTVTVNTANAVITGNNSICSGASTTFTASGGGTYLWSNGATSSSINITGLTANATFTVTVTSTNGCTGTATRTLTINPLPVPLVTTVPASGSVCVNGTATLTASGGVSYVWSTGASTASITTLPLTTNTPPNAYTVTVTNAEGCTATLTRIITVLPQPVVNVASNSPVCQGANITLTATGSGSTAPYTYVWTGGSTTNPLVVPATTSTTFAVTVTDANGCTRTTSSAVTVNPAPIAAITGDDMICLGESTTLTASGGGTYLWSANAGGVTTAAVTVSPTTTTTYVVTVTNSTTLCTSTASITVSVDPGVLMCQTQNITAYLDPTGKVTITPQMISTGTMGACNNFTATVAPNMFFCNDIQAPGPVYTVTLTVTNTNTNQSLSCTAQVTVADSIKPTITCPPNLTVACNLFNPNNLGTPTTNDNCPNGVVVLGPVVISTLNQCNVGSLTRTFTVRDASGNTRSCTQVVTVNNPTPLTLANISFPPNITVTNCQGVDPSVTGSPIITQVPCSDVSISFVNNTLLPSPLCGGTIIRTWTVIDSCQLSDTNPTAGRFTQTQTITVTVPAPVISGPLVINLAVSPITCTAVLNDVLHTAIGCNLVLSNSRNGLPSFNITGTYPVGTTNVTLTARETCNNQTVSQQVQIIVIDTTETEFTCMKTFPIILDTNPPMAFDTASNHVGSLEVSCSNPGIIRFSFSRTNVADSITVYDCSDLIADNTVKVYLWVNNTVIDSCTTISTVNDPGDHCTNSLVSISGKVSTENGQNVPSVLMGLEGATMTYPQTDLSGKYEFPLMDRGGEYTLNPKRNDKPMDGVSTLDLIMIQRHILKLSPLTSPYKLIAADVNKDNKISAIDIVELRKLIIGVYDKFPNNESWRLVDEKYNFPDPTNPFMGPFTEKYYIPALNSNMQLNWIGVKVGDVNSSYVSSAQDDITDSRNATFGLILDNHEVVNGHNSVNIIANQTNMIYGYQLSLDVKNLNNLKVVSGSQVISEDNYQITNDGQLLVSWNDRNATNVSKGEVLFTLEFDSDRQNDMSDVIKFGDGLAAEYYGTDLQVRKLSLSVAQPQVASFEVFGNSPNPWVESTDIKFALPADGNVELIVRDVTGRLLLSQTKEFSKGRNTITLNADDLNAKGILIYDIKFGEKTITGKMLNIK